MGTEYYQYYSGADVYAKSLPQDTATWSNGIVAGTEVGNTGTYSFALTDGTDYAIYLQLGSTEASTDTLLGVINSRAVDLANSGKLAADGLDDITLPDPSDATDVKSTWLKAMAWLFRRFARSTMTKSSDTAASLTVADDTGTTITTQAVSDDGTTQSVGEME